MVRPWRWGAPAWFTSAGTAVVALLTWHDYRLTGFLMSDYLLQAGPYPAVLIGERVMISTTMLRLLVLLAALSGVLLAGLLVERGLGLSPMLRWFLLLTVGGLLATRAAGQAVFGRYLMVLIPIMLFVVLVGRDRPRAATPRSPPSSSRCSGLGPGDGVRGAGRERWSASR